MERCRGRARPFIHLPYHERHTDPLQASGSGDERPDSAQLDELQMCGHPAAECNDAVDIRGVGDALVEHDRRRH